MSQVAFVVVVVENQVNKIASRFSDRSQSVASVLLVSEKRRHPVQGIPALQLHLPHCAKRDGVDVISSPA